MFGLPQARKVAALRSRDRLVLAEASVGLLAARLCVRRLPFGVWTRVLALSSSSGRNREAVPWPTVRRVVWAVDASARHLPGELTCLPRAVATRLMLRRRCIPSVLHVGVARDERGALRSHAWVECEGQVVMGSLPDLDRFVPIYRLDAHQRAVPAPPGRA